jgi:hypothetical protein
MTITGPTTISTTLTSSGVNSAHYPSDDTDTPVPPETTTPNTVITYSNVSDNTFWTTSYNNAYSSVYTSDYNSALATATAVLSLVENDLGGCPNINGYQALCLEYSYLDNGVTYATNTAAAQANATATADANSSTASYCTASQFGSSYNSGTETCIQVPTTTTTYTVTPGSQSYNSVMNSCASGPCTSPTSANPLLYEGLYSGPTLYFQSGSNDANFGGTETGGSGDLFFGGTGHIGAILEVTYQAEAEYLPEPFTFLLVGGALAGFGLLRRKNALRP